MYLNMGKPIIGNVLTARMCSRILTFISLRMRRFCFGIASTFLEAAENKDVLVDVCRLS